MEDKKMEQWIYQMAEKEVWKVPKSCEEKVERILETLSEASEKEETMRYLKKKRTFLLVAALVAVLGTTVAAAGIFQWREQAVENFGNPTKEEQDKMALEGIAMEQKASATDAGITITAQQTVQDKNTLYILLDVQAEEKILDGNGGFDNPEEDGSYKEPWIVTQEEDAFSNISMGFSPDTPAFGELTDHESYEISALKSMEKEWNEESVTIHFTEYSYYTYENGDTIPHKFRGDWTLVLPLGEETNLEMTQYKPVEPVELSGVPMQIKRVEVSPLSLLVVFDMDDVLKLQETVYTEDSEDIVLSELDFTGFLDQDGQEITARIGGQSGKYNYDTREIIHQIGLENYINPDKITTLLLGEEKVQVKLK